MYVVHSRPKKEISPMETSCLLHPLKRVLITQRLAALSSRKQLLTQELAACQAPRKRLLARRAQPDPQRLAHQIEELHRDLAQITMQMADLQEQEIAMLFIECFYDELLKL